MDRLTKLVIECNAQVPFPLTHNSHYPTAMADALTAVCKRFIIKKSSLQDTAAAEGMLSTEIQQQDAFATAPGALDEEHYFCGSPHQQPTPLTEPTG